MFSLCFFERGRYSHSDPETSIAFAYISHQKLTSAPIFVWHVYSNKNVFVQWGIWGYSQTKKKEKKKRHLRYSEWHRSGNKSAYSASLCLLQRTRHPERRPSPSPTPPAASPLMASSPSPRYRWRSRPPPCSRATRVCGRVSYIVSVSHVWLDSLILLHSCLTFSIAVHERFFWLIHSL